MNDEDIEGENNTGLAAGFNMFGTSNSMSMNLMAGVNREIHEPISS